MKHYGYLLKIEKMQNRPWCFVNSGRLLLAALASFALSACSGDSWKEEALQSDGSVIVVERTVDRGGKHEIGQQGSYIHQTMRFKLPASGQSIEWVDTLSPDLGNSSFLPMALNIAKGVPYLVAYPMGCMSYNKWGRPNPPYVVFKHEGASWQRVGLEQLPPEIKAPNLIFSDPDNVVKRLATNRVSTQQIKEILVEYKRPEFKAILREKMPEQMMCEKMIYYKCGWISPEGNFGKQFMDRSCK